MSSGGRPPNTPNPYSGTGILGYPSKTTNHSDIERPFSKHGLDRIVQIVHHRGATRIPFVKSDLFYVLLVDFVQVVVRKIEARR